MHRYTILDHDWPTPHFDLLFDLDSESDLLAFRLAAMPVVGEGVSLKRLPAHRRIYLDYEGPVNGNRGSVTRVDTGSFQILRHCEDSLVIELSGRVLSGIIELRWNPQGEGELVWLKES